MAKAYEIIEHEYDVVVVGAGGAAAPPSIKAAMDCAVLLFKAS